MIELACAEDAGAVGRVVADATESRGAFGLVTAAGRDPSARTSVIEPLLDQFSVGDLEAYAAEEQLQAAGAVCRAIGRFTSHYPAAARPVYPAALGGTVAQIVKHQRGNLAGRPLSWRAVTADDTVYPVTAIPALSTNRLGPFGADCELGESAGHLPGLFHEAHAPRRHPAWNARRRVHRTAVQFQLAAAVVAQQGCELANHCMHRDPPRELVDALAFRVPAIACARNHPAGRATAARRAGALRRVGRPMAVAARPAAASAPDEPEGDDRDARRANRAATVWMGCSRRPAAFRPRRR